MVSGHEAYEMFFGGEEKKESHTWATVASANSDGTANVMLNPSTATRCTCLCEVKAGDRVSRAGVQPKSRSDSERRSKCS